VWSIIGKFVTKQQKCLTGAIINALIRLIVFHAVILIILPLEGGKTGAVPRGCLFFIQVLGV
jgi:hypothetical protein